MKLLYDKLSAEVSRMTTKTYSTSFSLGIYFIDESLRNAIYAIYGFVRIADEIVDSFDGYDKKRLLEKFKRDTYEAIDERISTNPILNNFQQAVREFNIDPELIETFLQSMEMDLKKVDYTTEKFNQYILGSAEVVGLMCLCVFTEGSKIDYQRLKPYAMKLGAAFQKVNFLRDMKDDYYILGRTYFPNIDLRYFTEQQKRQIETEVENDFNIAREGIRMLPPSSKKGVYLAYVYYHSLFKKIKETPSDRLLKERIRINNRKKLQLMVNSLIQHKMDMI